MASYMVLERQGRDTVEDAIYIRDGFHWLAFLVPPLWLLFNRLWIEALAAIAVMSVLGTVASLLGLSAAGSLASALVALWIGLEAPALKAAALRRRGWRDWGVISAASRGEAEIRHLADKAEEPGVDDLAPGVAMPWGQAAGPSSPRRATGPALGMFSYPERT